MFSSVELVLLNPWLLFAVFVSLFILPYLLIRPKRTNLFRQPFASDVRRPCQPLESDQTKRATHLQQPFSEGALPSQIDAIVIGSGASGLTTAAILAKTGRKVVVLEKHSKAGGTCNSFSSHGYEWDVGIHYVGRMGPNDYERYLLDQLTEGQLDWQKMDEDFDNLVFVKGPNEKTITVPVWANGNRYLNDLIRRYPHQEKALRQFFAQIPSGGLHSKALYFFSALKLVPLWLAKLIIKTRLHKVFTTFFDQYHKVTVKSYLERLFGPGESDLKASISYISVLLNIEPNRAGRGALSLCYDYYERGAYYPVGGANEIPYSIIPTITKMGGRVFDNANVTEILLQGNKAIGVRVATNSGPVDVKAPLVISATGVSNTFTQLLPKEVAQRTKIGQMLESGRIKPGKALFLAFVGLKGSQAELKLPAKNIWLIYDTDFDGSLTNWQNLSLEDAARSGKIPLLYVTFPSAKDPTYNERHPGRSVCNIITLSSIDWYRKWKTETGYMKSDEREAAEMELAHRCWNLVVESFPELGNRLDHIGTGSPLWMCDTTNAYVGEPYGLDHDTERFAPEVAIALRPKVPEIDGLYLSGQSLLAGGFVTCLYSSLLTCQAILTQSGECPNVLKDAKRLFLLSRKQLKKKEREE